MEKGLVVRRLWCHRAITSVVVAVVAPVLWPGAAGATDQGPQAATARSVVSSVSNPPPQVQPRLRLRLAGSATVVSVYASPARRLVKGDVRLARFAALRGHRTVVKVPARLPAGAWFIVACPARGPGGCAASHRAMLKRPTRFSAPVLAHPVLETARAASATIGSAGGTLKLTDANGTAVRLDVPAGSVPDGTRITMTPLSSLTGGKWFGKLVGGVQLAPEGLLLARGGTLTITPKARVPVRNQVAAGYAGGGSDLHELPLAPTRAAIEIPLAHFSGAGIGNVAGGAGAPQAGSSAGDAYTGELAGIIRQWRSGDLSRADMERAAGAVLDAMYDQIMGTEVPPGLNRDDSARRAIADLIQWSRTSDMLLGKQTFAQIVPTIGRLLEGIYNRGQKACAEQDDFTAITTIVETARSEQLLGLKGHDFAEDFKCLRFRVDFDATITETDPEFTGGYTFQYVAQPTVTYGEQDLALTGSTTGSYATVSGTESADGEPVAWALYGTGAAFTVSKLDFDANDARPPVLVLSVERPSEFFGTQLNGTIAASFWYQGWTRLHPLESGLVGLTLKRGSGRLFATGTWSGSTTTETGLEMTESTSVDVYHTPPG